MVALNFGHDKEAVLELQQGGALACDLKVLSLEMKKFLDDNRFLNEMFLHFSLDDDDVPVANLFKISKMRFKYFSNLINLGWARSLRLWVWIWAPYL